LSCRSLASGGAGTIGNRVIPITAEIAYQAVALSPIHRDPFDRLIIATAIQENADLASVDHLFSQYSELGSRLMTAD
jgi:PIN domain nuclease of toxin-antitoxin system